MRVLYLTNQVYALNESHKMLIELLSNLGHIVIWCANFNSCIEDRDAFPCNTEHIDIKSRPFDRANRLAYKQICDIIKRYSIDAIHCHTPIGGFLGRLAGLKCGINPVLYTAHGFLFYSGCPLVNRTLYYWEERLLANFTDVLITINEEDYDAAQRFRTRSGHPVQIVNGAGVVAEVDCGKRAYVRPWLGIEESALLCFSAARIDKNKNIETVLKAFSQIKDVNAHYVVAGDGPNLRQLKEMAVNLQIDDRVHFIGFRTDIPELLNDADIFILSSIREGLSRAVMEAMAHGLPCIVSEARGNGELIGMDKGGVLCATTDAHAYAKAISFLACNSERRNEMGVRNKQAVRKYSIGRVREQYREIYERYLKNY